MSHAIMSSPRITVGLDLGDRYSQFCLLDADGTVVEEGRLRTTVDALQRYFAARQPMRIVVEVGTHSPWVSRGRGRYPLPLGKPSARGMWSRSTRGECPQGAFDLCWR
jgi:hypothetical protein